MTLHHFSRSGLRLWRIPVEFSLFHMPDLESRSLNERSENRRSAPNEGSDPDQGAPENRVDDVTCGPPSDLHVVQYAPGCSHCSAPAMR